MRSPPKRKENANAKDTEPTDGFLSDALRKSEMTLVGELVRPQVSSDVRLALFLNFGLQLRLWSPN